MFGAVEVHLTQKLSWVLDSFMDVPKAIMCFEDFQEFKDTQGSQWLWNVPKAPIGKDFFNFRRHPWVP